MNGRVRPNVSEDLPMTDFNIPTMIEPTDRAGTISALRKRNVATAPMRVLAPRNYFAVETGCPESTAAATFRPVFRINSLSASGVSAGGTRSTVFRQ